MSDVNPEDAKVLLDAKATFGSKLFNISPEDEKFLKKISEKNELTNADIQRMRTIAKKFNVTAMLKDLGVK